MKHRIISTHLYFAVAAAAFLIAPFSHAALNQCANPAEVTLSGDVKMKFCEIPGVSDGARSLRAFQMGQYEVTQLQYETVTGIEPWKLSDGTLRSNVVAAADNPAAYISFEATQQFLRILNLIDQRAVYRLPTEVEWEHAARGGATTAYHWGNEIDLNFAYYDQNSGATPHGHSVTGCPNSTIDSRFPGYCSNNFGLMHMLGNIFEWSSDEYVPPSPNEFNPNATYGHILRGGSWGHTADRLAFTYRSYTTDRRLFANVGLRVVRVPLQ